ncbi:MAG: arginine--tRNA ligase [Chloroflexi bacterium]|nr:arginine--tRNA ligase [Chloroflexota bacterium]
MTATDDAASTPLAPTSPRAAVEQLLREALAAAISSGALPALPPGIGEPDVDVARPPQQAKADLASSVALKLARPLRMAPLAIAAAVAASLEASAGASAVIGSIEVAHPGFINLRLTPGFLERSLDAVRTAGAAFGRVEVPGRHHVNVEFVSANPTGPLHIGNARGAFVGDLLCRVLEAGGREVTREYYFNDFGSQVMNLGASVLAIANGTDLPEDGYRGAYVHELAAELPDELVAATAASPDQATSIVGQWASERVRAGIEASLERLGVTFDVWFTESTLHREGWIQRAIERLQAGGHLFEQDGALWFRSTAFGDDKDRVIRRSNGAYTYFGADIGYVINKFERGFDHLIYLWGADHHGTVARNRNAAEAMGYDRSAVEMLLIAWVRFVRDGQDVSMSKRAGEFITLDDLLEEIGVDAARWYFAARATTSSIDFDIEAAKDPTAANPVHYVRYAHARISSILRKAAEAGLGPADSLDGTLAGDEVAQGLAREILRLPDVVGDAALAQETQGVTAYATELATVFHAFYRDRRVVDPEALETSRARLALVDAARLALASTLGLLGISAPDSM